MTLKFSHARVQQMICIFLVDLLTRYWKIQRLSVFESHLHTLQVTRIDDGRMLVLKDTVKTERLFRDCFALASFETDQYRYRLVARTVS